MGRNISFNSIQNQVNTYNTNKKSVNFNGAIGSKFTKGMELYQGAGFVLPFLAQDVLGSILPRTYQGYNRNQDVTGQHNPKEAVEVFLREVLTGPCMFLIPLAGFGLSQKVLGKTSYENSNTLKAYNKVLESTVKGLDTKTIEYHDLKSKFIRNTVEEALTLTLGKDNLKQEHVDTICTHLSTIKEKQQELRNHSLIDFAQRKSIKNEISDAKTAINKLVNTSIKSTSAELEHIGKIKITKTPISTGNFIDSILTYSNDIVRNVAKKASLPDAGEIGKIVTEVSNKALARRFAANIATLGATILFVTQIPKMYAHNNTAPGLNGLIDENQKNGSKNKKNVAFTGEISTLESIAKKVTGPIEQVSNWLGDKVKKTPDLVHEKFEFVKYNMTNAICALTFGLFVVPPRVMAAKNRAITNADGTKDNSEVKEIYYRDIPSLTAVIVGVPFLEKIGAKYFTKTSGSVLSTHSPKDASTFKKVLDIINPFGGLHVFKMDELNEIYGHIKDEAQIDNLAKFVENGNGDLVKIVNSLSKEHRGLFSDAKNASEVVKIMKEAVATQAKDGNLAKIKDLLSGDHLAYAAKKYNGGVSAASAMLLIPLILGVLIPRMTNKMTKDKFLKQKHNNENISQNTVANQQKLSTTPYFQNSEHMNKTFSSFLHS